MAYVLKYKIEFKTRATGVGRGLNGATAKDGVFEIEELDPANNTVYLFKSATAPIIDRTPDTENKDYQLISTKCIVNIKNTNAYSKLINFVTEDERKFRGTLKLDGAVKFKGWLLTDISTTNEIFNAKVSDLQLTFTDGIGTLENQEYRDSSDRKLYGKATIIEILTNINRITGLGLDLVAVGNFTSPALSGRVLEKQKISQLRFFNPDRTPFSCKKVLEQLCLKDFAHFYQKDGAFWFVPFSQYRKSTRVFNLYNNAGAYQSDITETGYKMIADGEDVDLGAGTAQRSYNAPYKKVTLSTKFNQTLLFENEQLEYYTAGSSDPIMLSTLIGVESQENNISFSGWTTIGTLKCSLLTFSDAYMGTIKSNWDVLDGTTKFGLFPYNNKVLVINKALSTSGAGFLSSKSQIRKGTTINFSVPIAHSLKYSASYQANNISYKIFVETKEGVKWYLFEDGKWYLFNTLLGLGSSLRLKRSNFRNIPDAEGGNVANVLGQLNSSNSQSCVLSANYDSQPCPVDGYLQILIEPFFNPQYSGDSQHGDLFQFHPPVVSIISLPKGIDKVTYESTITGKHTVLAPEQEVYFCDNSLDLIPCSVFDVNGVETSQYTLDNIVAEHMLLLPLLEKQVQFSRSFLKIRLNECYSHNLRIGDVFKFDATGFSDMSGAEFVVISMFGHDYRTAKMGIIACEIVESASNISYDIFIYNEGIKESIRRNIPYSTTAPLPVLNPPWFWIDIPSYDMITTNVPDITYAVYLLTGNSIVFDRGNGTSQTITTSFNGDYDYGTSEMRSLNFFGDATKITVLEFTFISDLKIARFTGLVRLTLNECDLNASKVNALIAEFRTLWSGNYSGKILDINGTGIAAPTGQGIADINYMNSNGATCTTN